VSYLQTIAVIGAGTMGQGIAQVFASGGFDTFLFDTNSPMVHTAINKIESALAVMVEKGKISVEDRNKTLRKIHPLENINEVKADLIIEAIVEVLAIKQELFQTLEKLNSSDTIFCSNTSSLSISKIFENCHDQSRCLGVHFFNPAHVMKLVELISGKNTSPVEMAEVASVLKQLGKITVTAKDFPGFIVNRVARHFYLESLKILEEGDITVEDLDALMKSSGFKMGPFELMDLIGIDINLAVSRAVYEGFDRNPKYKPNEIQIQKVNEGHLGRKSGKGFYEYSNN
jgi:3-hydroxybutyryl-CoA dehydrogenase